MGNVFTSSESSTRSACAMAKRNAAYKQGNPLGPLVIGIATASVLVASLLLATASLGSPNQSGYGVAPSEKE